MFSPAKVVYTFSLTLLFFIFTLFFSTSLAFAQAPAPVNNGTAIDSSNFGPWQFAPFSDYTKMGSIFCFTTGSNWASRQPCPSVAYDEASKKTKITLYDQLPDGGALGGVQKIMTAMYVGPPTSSGLYLAHLGSNLGLVDEAYAQSVGGSGNSVLEPILKLWQVFRNIAYIAFILIFIVVGLMIMFRRKMNAQTVVSAQTALPGLVIGLILVTFSYFIAALIVDLSFISMKLVAYIFVQSGIPNTIQDGTSNTTAALATNGNIFNLYWAFIAGGVWSTVVVPFANLLTSPFQGVYDSLGVVGDIAKYTSGLYLLGGAIGALLALILVIALFIQMIRLLWGLLNSYITILVFTVAGPLFIAIGSIPGNGGTITYWWKQILGNVLVFPAVFFAFLFAGAILGQDPGGVTNTNEFRGTLPLFAGMPVGVLKVLIAYGIVLGTPAIPGMVKTALGVKDIGAIGQEAIKGFGAGAAAGKAFGGRTLSTYMNESGIEAGRKAAREQRDDSYPLKAASTAAWNTRVGRIADSLMGGSKKTSDSH